MSAMYMEALRSKPATKRNMLVIDGRVVQSNVVWLAKNLVGRDRLSASIAMP